MNHAYAPYSEFKVGAAVLCEDGSIFTGCNIENASYGATICAERVAICTAVAAGNRDIEKIAIVSSSDKYTFPCGMCRQVMTEFMPEAGIIVLEQNSEIQEFRLEELLPNAFSGV